MEIIRCKNGHFYDKQKYEKCPHCSDLEKEPEPIPCLYGPPIPMPKPIDVPPFSRPYNYSGGNILNLIGSGSFGEVYSIGTEEKDSNIIVKVACGKEEKLKSIRNEIEILSKLKGSRNIVEIKNYVDEVSACFLFEEKCEKIGGNQGWILYDDIIKIGMDICDALIQCREKNIVDLDIRPSNILQKDGVYKLCDFGLAAHASNLQELIEKAIHFGNFNYMAPEVFEKHVYSEKTAIYTLGIVLYHLMSGVLPFRPHLSEEEAFKKRLKGVPFPEIIPDGYELAEVIKKACAFSENERYDSLKEFKLAIEKAGKTMTQDMCRREFRLPWDGPTLCFSSVN